MKIPFQSWLLDQNIDVDSRSLFNEALLCYQVGAYRAALVFSYLGLLRILAQRLMTADAPDSLPTSAWESIQRRIRDDNTWEAAAFEATLRVQPASVFLVDDDIRQQLQYWRGRRNDAAHSRGNEVSYAHVEMLWLFIRSNLGRFVVNGGRSGLLERFRRHFNPVYTPQGTDFSDLVALIVRSVVPAEYREFIRDVLGVTGVFEELKRYGELNHEVEALISYVQKFGDPRLIEALAQEIKSDPDLLVATLLAKPNYVLHYSNDSKLVWELWHDRLPFFKIQRSGVVRESLRVFAVLLRNNLVLESLRATAVDHVVGRISEGSSRDNYPDDLFVELAPFGFWEAVEKHLSNTEWAARNLVLATEYLERHPVDVRVARTFCDLFPNAVPDDSDGGYSWFHATNLAEPEDYVDLGFYFQDHASLFLSIVKVARKHKLNYRHFFKEMNPKRWAK